MRSPLIVWFLLYKLVDQGFRKSKLPIFANFQTSFQTEVVLTEVKLSAHFLTNHKTADQKKKSM